MENAQTNKSLTATTTNATLTQNVQLTTNAKTEIAHAHPNAMENNAEKIVAEAVAEIAEMATVKTAFA